MHFRPSTLQRNGDRVRACALQIPVAESGCMPRGRPPKHKTPEQEILSLLKWAEQQGFQNVAEVLRRVAEQLEARTNRNATKIIDLT
jgi:hypothetical protein